jgi:hypothetical protein
MASGERTQGTDPTGAEARAGAAPRDASAETGSAGQGDTEGSRAEAHSGAVSGPMAPATILERVTVSCLTNTHYHSCREAFLDTVHRWFMFFVIALGAAALTDVLPRLLNLASGITIDTALVKELCAAGAAVLAALDLTFDLSNRARSHAMMRRRYFELLAKVRAAKMTPAEAMVCLDEFSADEEPPYHVLHLICWNEAQRSVYGSL